MEKGLLRQIASFSYKALEGDFKTVKEALQNKRDLTDRRKGPKIRLPVGFIG